MSGRCLTILLLLWCTSVIMCVLCGLVDCSMLRLMNASLFVNQYSVVLLDIFGGRAELT